jgi:hypothetical protein
MKTALVTCVALLFAAGLAVAQSNEVIDEILEQEQATFGQAAYIAFLAAGEAPEDATVEEVYDGISWAEWNLEQKGMDDPVTLGEFSYLVMENLGIQGGLMYRMIPGPRYAARELDYLEFLLGSGAPNRALSGQEMLHVMGQALDFTSDGA